MKTELSTSLSVFMLVCSLFCGNFHEHLCSLSLDASTIALVEFVPCLTVGYDF